MNPSTNLREIVPNLWHWSAWHERWKVDLSSCAWKGSDALVLVDPVRLDDAHLAMLERIATPAAILLTNQNHERDADWFRRRYRIRVHVHRDAVPGIEIVPDEFFEDGAILPGGLRAVHAPGASPSETAFWSASSGGVLMIGDAVIRTPRMDLGFLPEEHCRDAARNRESVRKLLALGFDTASFGHGQPIHPGAKARLQALFS